MLTRNTHTRDRDFPLQLKGMNQLHQGGKQRDLFLVRQILGGGRQNLRPSIGHIPSLRPARRQMNRYYTIIKFPSAPSDEPFLFKGSDDF